MSAIGTKRTSACALQMSAFDPKRTSTYRRDFLMRAVEEITSALLIDLPYTFHAWVAEHHFLVTSH